MAVPLGAFASGLFGGFNTALNAWGMYQELEQRATQHAGAKALQAAKAEQDARDKADREKPVELVKSTEPATGPAQTQTQVRNTPVDLRSIAAGGTPPAPGEPALPTPPLPPGVAPGTGAPLPTPAGIETGTPATYPPTVGQPTEFDPRAPSKAPQQTVQAPGTLPYSPDAYGPPAALNPNWRGPGQVVAAAANQPRPFYDGQGGYPLEADPTVGTPQRVPLHIQERQARRDRRELRNAPPPAGIQTQPPPVIQPPAQTMQTAQPQQGIGAIPTPVMQGGYPLEADPTAGTPQRIPLHIQEREARRARRETRNAQEPGPPVVEAPPGAVRTPGSGMGGGVATPEEAGSLPEASLGQRILNGLGSLNPISSAQAQSAPTAPGPPLTVPSAAAPAGSPGGINTAASTVERTGLMQAVDDGGPTKGSSAPAQAGPVPDNMSVVPPQAGQQTGPSQASETTTVVPRMDTRPYQWLARNAPQDKALVDKIAAEVGINPIRLALHWHIESGLKHTSVDSKDGAQGIMQVIPGTQRLVDPQRQLDPSKYEDSLRLGARYIARMNGEFGEDTPASFYAYMRGPGGAARMARDMNTERQQQPDGWKALEAAFAGSSLQSTSFATTGSMTPRGLLQAVENGPTGMVQYFHTNGPKNMTMTDTMRHAENLLVTAALMKGDYAGAQHAQTLMLQMSQQGAASNLMAAHQQAAAGNMQGAAMSLARAHAFFPDGTMGKFGVDSNNRLWGQQFDERDPSKPIGGPFQITPDTISGILIQTRDPNVYAKFVAEQQKNAADARYKDALGNYYGGKLGVEMDIARLNAANSSANNQANNITSMLNNENTNATSRLNNRDTNAAHERTANLTMERALAAQKAQYEKEARTAIDKHLEDNQELTAGIHEQHRVIVPRIAQGIALEPANNRMPIGAAVQIAARVARGELVAGRDRNGQPIIADPKRGENGFIAYVSPEMADAIMKMSANKPPARPNPANSVAIPAAAR